jgi:GLPGLI family protein
MLRRSILIYFLILIDNNLINAQNNYVIEYEHLLHDNRDKYGADWKSFSKLITNEKESVSYSRAIDTIFVLGENNNYIQEASDYTISNYKNLNKKEYYSGTIYPKYNLVDSTYHIEWEIKPMSKTILNYKCQLARGSLRGRTYSVYFTTEIPIKNGPHKFDGLPGLVLEIVSDDKCVFYKAKSISRTDEKIENTYLDKTLINWNIYSKNYKIYFNKMINYSPEEGVTYAVPNRTIEYYFEPDN